MYMSEIGSINAPNMYISVSWGLSAERSPLELSTYLIWWNSFNASDHVYNRKSRTVVTQINSENRESYLKRPIALK